MHPTDESGTPIDALLADAQILADYDLSQAPTAAERIARAAARNRPDLVVCHVTHPDRDERARQELDLICAQVLNIPQAAASLTSLSQPGDTPQVEPDGALDVAFMQEACNTSVDAHVLFQRSTNGGQSFLPHAVQVDKPGQFKDFIDKAKDDTLPPTAFRAPNTPSLAFDARTGSLTW